jgi:hypothetical protein
MEDLAPYIAETVRTIFRDPKPTFAINLFGRKQTQSSHPAIQLETRLYDCIQLGCTCSEPRDTVYALLRISQDCQDGELVPDYVKLI